MPQLTSASLPQLDPAVAVPGYDRADLATGVVHIGVGGFHRAHQAMFHDRLLAAGHGDGWALHGAGVLPGDGAMIEALEAQDGLYTLVAKHADGTYEPRVIGSIGRVEHAADDPGPLVARMASEATRIVSLTVTEGGYTPENHTFALLADALGRRRAAGLAPFTVMSCDNLEDNGARAREALLAHVEDEELAAWIAEHGAFPQSMVDRITPQTTDADRAELLERFGIEDRRPVVCEPFVQWVLEDAFAAGRPAYEEVGVQVVADVRPYELVKLRLLNGSHQALGHFGVLLGHEHVHEAAADDDLVAFVRGYMGEAATTLDPVPGLDVDDYRATLLERFANPEIRDTTARLAEHTADRIPRFVLPVAHARLAAGEDVRHCAAIVAAWARHPGEGDPQGTGDAFLEDRELFGDLGEQEAFLAPYRDAVRSLQDDGPRATLRTLRDAA